MINFPGQNSPGFFFTVCSSQAAISHGQWAQVWTICPKGKFILAAAERETLVDWYQLVH